MERNKVSVHVNVHYSEPHKGGFTVYKEDTVIFPMEAAEREAALKHVIDLLYRNPDAYAYIVTLTQTDRLNRHGAREFDKKNVRMFHFVGNGVVQVKEWDDEEEMFDRGEHYVDKRVALEELSGEIDVQLFMAGR